MRTAGKNLRRNGPCRRRQIRALCLTGREPVTADGGGGGGASRGGDAGTVEACCCPTGAHRRKGGAACRVRANTTGVRGKRAPEAAVRGKAKHHRRRVPLFRGAGWTAGDAEAVVGVLGHSGAECRGQ